MLLSPTTKNRIQGRQWGRGADSEKIWGEGRRIIWGEGEGRERREDKGREIDGVRMRTRQTGQKKRRKGRKREQWVKTEEKREKVGERDGQGAPWVQAPS